MSSELDNSLLGHQLTASPSTTTPVQSTSRIPTDRTDSPDDLETQPVNACRKRVGSEAMTAAGVSRRNDKNKKLIHCPVPDCTSRGFTEQHNLSYLEQITYSRMKINALMAHVRNVENTLGGRGTLNVILAKTNGLATTQPLRVDFETMIYFVVYQESIVILGDVLRIQIFVVLDVL
ncbi:hypothetical protein L218DRAFT_944891 [Marasmius fiardii PR-910]|nr:hypothetical protein L218DRAFT_944891 [Marasmius fiardii PR-910]